MTEIDKDFYCYEGKYDNGYCKDCDVNTKHTQNCGNCRRKWPTPEQFEAEYGFEYPDDGAVYTLSIIENFNRAIGWETTEWGKVKHQYGNRINIGKSPPIFMTVYVVCSCTPFGKPPAGWRPE